MGADAPRGGDPRDAEIAQLRERLDTLTQAVAFALGPIPDPTQPVPAELSAALAAAPSQATAPVRVRCHGREITVFAHGGTGVSPAAVWDAVLRAVPHVPAREMPGFARADLTTAVSAIADGRRLTINSTLAGPAARAATRQVYRHTRRAGAIAVPAVAIWWLRNLISRVKLAGAIGRHATAVTACTAVTAVACLGLTLHLPVRHSAPQPGATSVTPGLAAAHIPGPGSEPTHAGPESIKALRPHTRGSLSTTSAFRHPSERVALPSPALVISTSPQPGHSTMPGLGVVQLLGKSPVLRLSLHPQPAPPPVPVYRLLPAPRSTHLPLPAPPPVRHVVRRLVKTVRQVGHVVHRVVHKAHHAVRRVVCRLGLCHRTGLGGL